MEEQIQEMKRLSIGTGWCRAIFRVRVPSGQGDGFISLHQGSLAANQNHNLGHTLEIPLNKCGRDEAVALAVNRKEMPSTPLTPPML